MSRRITEVKTIIEMKMLTYKRQKVLESVTGRARNTAWRWRAHRGEARNSMPRSTKQAKPHAEVR